MRVFSYKTTTDTTPSRQLRTLREPFVIIETTLVEDGSYYMVWEADFSSLKKGIYEFAFYNEKEQILNTLKIMKDGE